MSDCPIHCLFRGLCWPVDCVLDFVHGLCRGSSGNSPFLQGNFAPVKYTVKATDLKVHGKIPVDLRGEFVRNGPNPVYIPKGGYHWFDGDGMLHGVRLVNGKVNYVNRYVRTAQFVQEERSGRSLYLRLGELWGVVGLFKVIFQAIKMAIGVIRKKDVGTANTALVYHDGRLMALVESSLPWVIKMHLDGDLETMARYDYDDKLQHAFTAHPKVDPETGEMVFFGYKLHEEPYCVFSVVSKEGELLRSVDVGIKTPVMMHDTAITKNYTIVTDFPLQFHKKNLPTKKPVLIFNENANSRLIVFPRHATDIGTEAKIFNFPAGYGFHSVNAWEEGDEVVLLHCYAKSFKFSQFGDNSMKSWNDETMPQIYLFRMNMKTGACSNRKVSNVVGEFPVVNPHYLGRRTTYTYLAGISLDEIETAPFFTSVTKFDLSPIHGKKDGDIVEVGRITFGAGKHAGECTFVPRLGGVSEDDGYLLTFVSDDEKGTSEFWIMNALTMSNEPIAIVPLPQRVPYGFHGLWVTEEQIKQQRS